MKLLNLKERIDEAKAKARKLKETRERILSESCREIDDTETEEERFHRIMNDPSAWM